MRFLVVSIFISVNIISQAQNGDIKLCSLTLQGVVLDVETHENLPYAAIQISGDSALGIITNENGGFIIEGLCPGNYSLDISHVGCGTKSTSINLVSDSSIIIHLRHDEHALNEIIIAEHSNSYTGTLQSYAVSGLQLKRKSSTNLGSILKDLPGIWALETGPTISKPSIHGLHSNRILIINNGVRLEGQQWGSEHGPEIDVNIANDITVIKGASSVRYGSDAIGGVILISPSKLPYGKGITGDLAVGGNSNSLGGFFNGAVEGSFGVGKQFAWRLQGSLKQGGDSKAPEYILTNTAYKEYATSGSLGWQNDRISSELFLSYYNNKLGILAASHTGNLTDLETALASDRPLIIDDFSYSISTPRQEIEHALLKSLTTLHLNSGGHIDLTIAYQDNTRLEFDQDRNTEDGPSLNFNIGTLNTELVYKHRLSSSVNGSVGISYINQQNIWSGRYFIPAFRSNAGGVFIIEQWGGRNIIVEVGLRYDIKNLSVFRNDGVSVERTDRNFDNSTFSIGAYYNLNKDLILRLNTGSAWRAPAINELYASGLHHGAAAIEVGNIDLGEELAWNTSLGLEWHHNRFRADAEVYSNIINDFIYLNPTGEVSLTIAGAFPIFEYKQIDAALYGSDMMLGIQLVKDLELTLVASLLYAQDRTNDSWIINMPSNRYGGGLAYHFHDSKDNAWNLELGAQYVERQNRVPENNDFALPPSGYALLDFLISSDFTISNQQINWSLSANNILNQAYRDYLDRFRYYADAPGRNIQLTINLPINK